MRLDIKKLAAATMLAWAVWYTVCAFLVAVVPVETQAVFSYAFHYDLTGSRPISWWAYCFGLIATTAWVGLFVVTAGWFFNAQVGERQPVPPGREAVRHP